ncbi:hypothetical protein TRVA0_009S02278 [Trichomonascus vanleenenianus]|uniref:uncharacterized protein n=1 Tax=Trichomonascus vanleenenianus TaxID=2268995 RepID=UPI003ECA13FE
MNVAWKDRLSLALAKDTSESTDKVFLPQSVLQVLVDQAQARQIDLPSPLTFQISTRTKVTHVGVREFSAPEGTVLVPKMVAEILETNDGKVHVELVELPKGSRLKIKPLEDENVVENWKLLLESQLRASHTTLTKGDIISVDDPASPDKVHRLLVEELEPQDAVCIVDTDIDLEVSTMTSAPKLDSPHVSTTNQDSSASAMPDSIEVGKTYTDVLVGHKPSHTKLLGWKKDIPLVFEYSSSSLDGRVQIFVSPAPDVSSSSFLWSSVESPHPTEFLVSAQNWSMSSELDSLNIAFYADRDTSVTFSLSPYKLSMEMDQEEVESEETTKCPNCKEVIPKQSYQLHSAVCFRNRVRCEICDNVYLRQQGGIPSAHWHCIHDDGDHNMIFTSDSAEDKKMHDRYFHDPAEACACGEFGSVNGLLAKAQHKTTSCAKSLHICRFCHLLLPRGLRNNADPVDIIQGLSSHESHCGSKTDECPMCHNVIKRRDMPVHMKMHDMRRLDQSKPTLCSNKNCCRVVPASSNNALGLCAFCFGPLHSTQYDPTGCKLRSRLERRYVIQLTRGCGKSWCVNKFCVTGNPQPTKPSMGEIMKDVADLLPLSYYYFCVDEMTTKRMMFVSYESQEGDYEPEWCALAIENAMGNEGEARRWLETNAIKRSESAKKRSSL